MSTSDEQAQPSPELLNFFRLVDPEKDAAEFWGNLRAHYQDPRDGSWRADWEGFYFPGSLDFTKAVFRGAANLGGAMFRRRAIFDDATFEGDVDFARVNFAELARFQRTTFSGDARYRKATFEDKALFGGSTFEKGVGFGEATFASEFRFRGTTIKGNASFGRAAFTGEAVIELVRFEGHANFGNAVFARRASFDRSTFFRDAKFGDVKIAEEADFKRVTFVGPVDFSGAELRRGLFHQVAIESEIMLDVTVLPEGALQFREAVNSRKEESGAPDSGPVIRFGPMSLARVELHSLNPSRIRLTGATDVDRLSFFGVSWPTSRRQHTIADEDDLAPYDRRDPRASEVERLYRALRKNLEDRSDRVGAHKWYVAEMEVGRHHSPDPLTRYARHFYWLTSGYGLSALRASIALLLVATAAFLLYMIPWSGICPQSESGVLSSTSCTDWSSTLKLIMLAVSFQGVPGDVALTGLLPNAVWLFARFAGAAMLLSIGVAFRNQVSR